jgi:MFS family permease
MTPFALGAAAYAVIAGRLMARARRWLTVSGLTTTAVGLVATALVLRHAGATRPAWATAGLLLVAGMGGGMVASPNLTLTLESVPVSMAGAAGGALQTAQRSGAAIGTAVLPRSTTTCSPTPAATTRWRHPTRCCLPSGSCCSHC